MISKVEFISKKDKLNNDPAYVGYLVLRCEFKTIKENDEGEKEELIEIREFDKPKRIRKYLINYLQQFNDDEEKVIKRVEQILSYITKELNFRITIVGFGDELAVLDNSSINKININSIINKVNKKLERIIRILSK